MSKGRRVPDQHIDHAAQLRDRLGRAAYDAMPVEPGDVSWDRLTEAGREMWRRVGQAVMNQIVDQGSRSGEFSVSSIYGYASKKPYVNVEVSVSPMQMSPGKAREVALMLLEAADAAESDAVMIGYARDVLGLGEAESAKLLNQLRQYRDKQRGSAVGSA
jgi:hypothetical protein